MRFPVGFGFALLVSCAEERAPVVTPKSEPVEAPDVPTFCASNAKPCVPPQDFVERLCADRYVSVAPYLFQKHTPFGRLHAKSRSIELKNGFHGPTGAQPVAFGEEVLLLRVTSVPADSPKKPAEEIEDVLRWDGTCATVAKHDLVAYLPGMPQAAPVEFANLDTTMRAALVRDAKLNKLSQARSLACHDEGASDACTQADKSLSDAIVAAVRQGLRLPMPRHRPPASKDAVSSTEPNAAGAGDETHTSAPSKPQRK